MHFETLNFIAVSIAIITIVFYFLKKSETINSKKGTQIILASLAEIIIIIHFIIQPKIEIWFPGYYGRPLSGGQYNWTTPGEFFLKLLLSALFGVELPIFSFMATTFIGKIIGYSLARDDVKRDMPKKGILIGLLVIISSVVILLADMIQFKVEFNVFPTWFYLFTTGLQIIILLWVLRMVEFSERVTKSEKLNKFIRKTVLVRRWGMVSLSLFVS